MKTPPGFLAPAPTVSVEPVDIVSQREMTEEQAAQLQKILAELREALDGAAEALKFGHPILPFYVGNLVGIDFNLRAWVQHQWLARREGG